MRQFDLRKVWRLALGYSVAALAAACGGHDGGPTGPGAAGLAGQYTLTGLNGALVPATVQPEDCPTSQWVNGGMALGANGRWQMAINWIDDENIPQVLRDEGQFRARGGELSFQSDVFGDGFEGEFDEDEVVFYYNFCTHSPDEDLDFVFSR